MHKALLVLSIVLISTFGAGIADILFMDVVPLRPYTGVYITAYIQNTVSEIMMNISIPLLFVIMVIVLFSLSIVFHVPIFGIMLTKNRMEHTVSLRRHRGQTAEITNFNKVEDNSEKVVKKRRRLKRRPTKVDQFEILVYNTTSVPLVEEV